MSNFPNIHPSIYLKLDEMITLQWEKAKVIYNKPSMPRSKIQAMVYSLFGIIQIVEENTDLKPAKKLRVKRVSQKVKV